MIHWWALAAALFLSLGLAACSVPDAARTDDNAAAGDPVLAADSPVALTPYAQEGNAALIAGTLVLEEDCLYLRDDAGQRLLPTFPWPGTAWDAATSTLTIFGEQRFRVGQRLEAGGGFVSSDSARADAPAMQRLLVIPRPRCDVSRVAILYFGPNSSPIR